MHVEARLIASAHSTASFGTPRFYSGQSSDPGSVAETVPVSEPVSAPVPGAVPGVAQATPCGSATASTACEPG